LELGCGPNKTSGNIGIDRLDLPGVDIIADLEEGLPFLPANSVDCIYSKSFLEHVDHLDLLMREIWRVLKPEGEMCAFVPHFSNPFFYSDYTHKHFCGLYTFEYFSKSQLRFHRKVPNFYQDFSFQTMDLQLSFHAGSRWLSWLRIGSEKLFNLSPRWQELYEEHFCYLIPCYGINVTIKKERTVSQ
jgi:predicted SAM-dependent methyltransferase